MELQLRMSGEYLVCLMTHRTKIKGEAWIANYYCVVMAALSVSFGP